MLIHLGSRRCNSMYKIINEITGNVSCYDTEIEQGFALDEILDIIDYKYSFLTYKVIHNGDTIIIREVNNEQRIER